MHPRAVTAGRWRRPRGRPCGRSTRVRYPCSSTEQVPSAMSAGRNQASRGGRFVGDPEVTRATARPSYAGIRSHPRGSRGRRDRTRSRRRCRAPHPRSGSGVGRGSTARVCPKPFIQCSRTPGGATRLRWRLTATWIVDSSRALRPGPSPARDHPCLVDKECLEFGHDQIVDGGTPSGKGNRSPDREAHLLISACPSPAVRCRALCGRVRRSA
jgi:hypothetical protein